MKEQLIHGAILVAVAATIFFTSLGKARLWDRDEPRNAGCAVEMMQRGDLVVPIFNDELRHQKPALLYWLMIGAYSVLGVSEFAARLPSALLGLGTVLLTLRIARRLFDPQVGLLAGIALPSSVMFAVAARAATPDAALIFFSTLGIYFYVRSTFVRDADQQLQLRITGQWFPQRTWPAASIYTALALAVLAKGPIGILMPMAIVGMFLLIMRLEPRPVSEQGPVSRLVTGAARVFNPLHFLRTSWSMRPILAAVTLIVIAAPWYVAVGVATEGDFTRLFFLNENFARATTVMENHSGGWWYYPAAIAVGFFPWSIFLAPMLIAADSQFRRRSRNRIAMTLVCCWIGVQVGLFSLAETKLPSYVTPCYPALAMLVSFCLLRWLPKVATAPSNWYFGAFGTSVAAGLLISIGLGVAAGRYFPEIWWVSLVGLVPIVGGVAGILLVRFSVRQTATPTIAATSILFCLLLFGVGTVAVDSSRTTDVVLQQIRDAHPDSHVATWRCLESSWVFYAGRPIHELAQANVEDSDSELLQRDRYWHRKPNVSPELFATVNPSALFVTTDEHVEELLRRLPGDFQIATRTDFFLQDDQKLVLVKPVQSEKMAESHRSSEVR